MDVYINQMSSTLRATDSQALLNPAILQQVLRLMREQLRQEREHEQRAEAERRLRSGVSDSASDSGQL